ncbi:MAG TPA: triose-phosphate isomerase [bacterium]|nr:triose-phosphate isomerase [bacterium]
MRVPLIAGNWKMHLTREAAVRLARDVVAAVAEITGPQVVLCPPATALEAVGRAIEGTSVLLGAQTMHWEPEGAYTGEIAAPMLVDLGCRVVILGHSERRLYCGERDADVGLKAQTALAHGLTPIVCVGEGLQDRERGDADGVIVRQLSAATNTIPPDRLHDVVIAYEPVWAIGTGLTATGAEADRVAALIRAQLATAGSVPAAEKVRVLYGGSVKPANIGEFLERPGIDGALVGGASLDAGAFAEIVRAAAR